MACVFFGSEDKDIVFNIVSIETGGAIGGIVSGSGQREYMMTLDHFGYSGIHCVCLRTHQEKV
jgi:hypothetical protein